MYLARHSHHSDRTDAQGLGTFESSALHLVALSPQPAFPVLGALEAFQGSIPLIDSVTSLSFLSIRMSEGVSLYIASSWICLARFQGTSRVSLSFGSRVLWGSGSDLFRSSRLGTLAHGPENRVVDKLALLKR